MDKIAQIKLAETHGVLAALADTGLLKVASEEDFDFMTEKVAEALGDDYDMDQVISKTAGCEYLMDKIASEEFAIDEVAEVMDKEACTFADLGEFLMLKEAASVAGTVEGAKNLGKSMFHGDVNLAKIKDGLKNVATGKGVREAYGNLKAIQSQIGQRMGAFQSAGLRAKDLPAEHAWNKGLEAAKKTRKGDAIQLLKEVGKTTGLYGTGIVGAGVGGKKLYDRFKSDK